MLDENHMNIYAFMFWQIQKKKKKRKETVPCGIYLCYTKENSKLEGPTSATLPVVTTLSSSGKTQKPAGCSQMEKRRSKS